MFKSIEATGKTIDLAIQAGLDTLGMDRDSVSVEVLEQPKSGFFGIGASPAKVSLTYEVPDPKPEKTSEPPKAESKPRATQAQGSPRSACPQGGSQARAQAYPCPRTGGHRGGKDRSLYEGSAGSTWAPTPCPPATKVDEDTYAVELIGEHLGMLIGRRGDTMDAIQHITNYAVNHGQNKRVRVNVDAENYRKKREESLERLANKVAGKVTKSRRNITLEPMNAYERHVIHAALQDYPDVTTYSTGTEPGRRIVVAYSKYRSAPTEE